MAGTADIGGRDGGKAGAERIVAALVEDIVLGRLFAHARLVEDDLIERFAEKRHIVRQGLGELEQMGLVARVPNRGATVRAYSPAEVEQIYGVRVLLAAAAARLFPLPLADDRLSRLDGLQREHEAAVAGRDVRAAFRTNIAFHRAFHALCGNPFLADTIEHYGQKCHAIRFFALTDPDLLQAGSDDHRAMLRAVASGDRAALVRLSTEHLRPCKEAFLRASRPGA
jgi:DNA-binding GntR family transcriptional regulator